jgi:hypothetical protein
LVLHCFRPFEHAARTDLLIRRSRQVVQDRPSWSVRWVDTPPAGVSVLGWALTLVLPEPAGRSLEEMAVNTHDAGPRPLRLADQASAP